MAYKESDIVFEAGNYWVAKDTKRKLYVVYRAGITHSVEDIAMALNEDGLSLAIARAKYLAKRRNAKG